MLRCCVLLVFAIFFGMLVGCQKAQQFPAVGKKVEVKEDIKPGENESFLRELTWSELGATRDTPIVFVPAGSPEWGKLKKYWNEAPFPVGLPTIHIGFSPLEIAAAWVVVEQNTDIKIKVPLGLPDPTPHLPGANPPTVGKWRLGKTLFHWPIVRTDKRTVSCVTCHDPRRAFAEDPSNPAQTKRSAPSLLNVVYNRRQFWDGRVDSLEETLFRGLDDERQLTPEKRLERGLEEHNWGGWVRELVEKKDKDLHKQFLEVFGVEHPTQATVSQALATYMRTLLAGDSLYDQAAEARQAKDVARSASLFGQLLKDDAAVQTLRDTVTSDGPKKDELAMLWAKGHELFHGRARCAKCHDGALLTDQDYHNIGCDLKENWPEGRKETGRSVLLPPGLKEPRYLGAFRTPSLRNLKSKHRYFHDGSRVNLYDVVDFYDRGILKLPHVATPLLRGTEAQLLILNQAEKNALVVYLRSMEGRRED
jgi:cytochrome c peroxidase